MFSFSRLRSLTVCVIQLEEYTGPRKKYFVASFSYDLKKANLLLKDIFEKRQSRKKGLPIHRATRWFFWGRGKNRTEEHKILMLFIYSLLMAMRPKFASFVVSDWETLGWTNYIGIIEY